MSWTSVTRDRFLGFHAKEETEFSRKFYKNIKPVGMDKYKSILTIDRLRSSTTNKTIKKSLNNDENPLRNSLNIRSELAESNKIDEPSKKSQYEIFALLSVAGRTL